MVERGVRIWYDAEGDYLEVLFDQREGFFRSTADDRVMEKVDTRGVVLGFSILGLSAIKGEPPLQVALASGIEP
jgi:hypothetical protein